jgi:phage terminase small subunit
VLKLKLEKIEKELLSKVNKKSAVDQEKVSRYINLLAIFYSLDQSIEEKGVMVETVNATQVFLKPNPAIAEKNKINTSLIALGRDLELSQPPPKKEAMKSSYSASDLT